MNNNFFNIYCDESCHLQNDRQPVMLFGCIWCPTLDAALLANQLKEIMKKHHALGELKWTKVSVSREHFYLEVIDWFFSQTELHFRGLIILNKDMLDHQSFNEGSHDNFYYKSYFSLLNKVMNPNDRYSIYLDVKDTRSRHKIRKLKEILCNNVHDFTGQMIKHIQNIHSHESLLMQLADFLLGIVSYRNRHLEASPTKKMLAEKLESRLGYALTQSTSLSQTKFNLFVFSPKAKQGLK